MPGPLKSIIMHMYSVLGLGPCCMNYCLNAAWHGCYQHVALLRCYRDQDASVAGFSLSALFSLMSHLSLDNTP